MIDPIGTQTLEIMGSAVNYNKRLLSLIRPWLKGKILEVGAGTGTFASQFMQDGYKVAALDINQDYLTLLAKQFKGMPVYKFDLESSKLPKVLTGEFETVVMLNVLEHIKNDVQALANIYSMLKPKGSLILIVPAHAWAYGSVDKNLGHHRRYEQELLYKRLMAAGFKIRKIRYISPVAIVGWWMSAKVLKSSVIPSAQLRIFDPLVPAFSILEDILKLPLGMSLFAVGEKT